MASRRFFQISIRTLFIVTTLVAIGLAYFNRIRQRVEEQKAATARIAALGGKATVKPMSYVWPSFRKAVGEEYFKEVVAVDLENTLVTDADLEVVGRLRDMKSLVLSGLPVSERSGYMGPFLPQNPNLVSSQVSSKGIRGLGPQHKLQDVRLAHVPINDEAMDTVSSWTQLQILDLERTRVTSKGVQRLENLKHLKSLNLAGTNIDDSVVPALSQMRSLQQLDLSDTAVTGEGLLQLRNELPACKLSGSLLDFSDGIDPDPQSMRWKEITRPMWALSRRGQLKFLCLADTAATDAHLEDLDRLKNVEVIDLRRTKVTDAGIESLRRALPKCKIVR
ncbi:MAG: leucine-rich repeat domain-containing protein [Pirellulaceae bacterium]